MRFPPHVFASLSLVLGLATTLPAQITLTATQRGWYDQHGDPSASANFFVGVTGGLTVRNYFVFDRAGAPELAGKTATRATMEIFLPNNEGDAYFSEDATDSGALYSLFGFNGDIASLINGTGGVAAYEALGSGSLWGTQTVSAADNAPGRLVTIELLPSFLDYFNSADGLFAMGGELTDPLDGIDSGADYMFAFTELAPDVRLRLEFGAVPEPSTYGLMGASALAVVIWRRNRRAAR